MVTVSRGGPVRNGYLAAGATHPYAVEMALAVTHTGALGPCDDDTEFAFGLDFILDGLARLRNG